MACSGKCIPMVFGNSDPTALVFTTRPMRKSSGEIWEAGTKHWRCPDCLANKADTPKPRVVPTDDGHPRYNSTEGCEGIREEEQPSFCCADTLERLQR